MSDDFSPTSAEEIKQGLEDTTNSLLTALKGGETYLALVPVDKFPKHPYGEGEPYICQECGEEVKDRGYVMTEEMM